MGDFGKLNFSVSFNRTSAFPIEANGYFESLEAAQAAAQTAVEVGSAESTYYIGQMLTVVDENKSELYVIQPDKSLNTVGITQFKTIDGNDILGVGNITIDKYTKAESDSKYLSLDNFKFTQHQQGIYTKILEFTINEGSYVASISFTWHPTERIREVWADFNINIRQNDIRFLANWKGTITKDMYCVGNGTTFSVWVKGEKDGYDPYGIIQVINKFDIISYNAGALAYQDTEPTDLYTAKALLTGLSYNAKNADIATISNSSEVLNNNYKMDYGWDGINYFNINGPAGNGAKVNDTPTSAWWHILRFNHGNSSGYYTDLAVPFNNNSLYYKRIAGGEVQNNGWVQIWDATNFDPNYLQSKNLFINTGDATLKFYSGMTTDVQNDGNICLQTSIDETDGETHSYPVRHSSRCNLVLQPRGGQVYIGNNPSTGNTNYKLNVYGKIHSTEGYVKEGSSDSYVLLGGGGHKLLSELGSSSGVGKVDPNSDGTGEIFNSYNNNKATGQYSHAEGYHSKATGNYSHAEGNGTTASGSYSHAEGQYTRAEGSYSHAEGNGTTASGDNSHAEGVNTTASGSYSHAEGQYSRAEGSYSHAEGFITEALGEHSHSANAYTVADNYAQTSIGRYNEEDSNPKPNNYDNTKPAFLIGNGNGSSSRGNAFKVLFNGQTFADGEYSSAGADYAEFFEWKDANPTNEDRVGRFVTLDGDKIRLATATDTYILGIISGAPTIIGDNPMRWWGKYLNDEWGRPIYEDVEVTYTEPEMQEDGTYKEIEKTRIDHIRKLNPEYNSEETYIPRSERPEWDYVGMMGKLLVKQDGTLVAGGFCKSIEGGIATKSESGYYVMKVINENQALILFK